jgi:hypothetical protein
MDHSMANSSVLATQSRLLSGARACRATTEADALPGLEGSDRRPGIGDLINLLSRPRSSEQYGMELAHAVCAVLEGEHCSITLYDRDTDSSKVRVYSVSREGVSSSRTAQLCIERADDRTLVLPICGAGQNAGTLSVVRAASQPAFNSHHREMAQIVTCFLGRSLQVMYLRNLLESRFARVALAEHATGRRTDEMLRSAFYPDDMVKMLARSFYREMRKAGFIPSQIINAASEIISQLTVGLKVGSGHSKRTAEGPATPAVTSEGDTVAADRGFGLNCV